MHVNRVLPATCAMPVCLTLQTCVQDMPEGLHGTFPVRNGGDIYIAGGGTQAAYSQSKAAYKFKP